MIICEKCFCDNELISVIKSKASLGDCPICKNKGVYVYDTEEDDEISLRFDELISIYTPERLLPQTFPKGETRLLKTELTNNWAIFNQKTEAEVDEIVKAICKERYADDNELFDMPVGIQELYDPGYLSEHSLLLTNSWQDFVDSLKRKNRFHTHYLNLELLRRFCTYIRKPYKEGALFYRCRLSTESGIVKEEMGAPPIDKTADGRANARGIRCLYLSGDIDTTIYETRAGVYDYVTVGTFRLKKNIIVADFKMINQISPFIENLDCLECAINREHLNRIDDEMGKVMRRSDDALEYVPTQYIADYVKSIVHDGKPEYDGIEYKSVMHQGGYNLAMFDPDAYECVDAQVYKIDNIDYKKGKISEV